METQKKKSETFDTSIARIVSAYDIMSKTINPLPMLKLDLTASQIKVLMSFIHNENYTMTELSKEHSVSVSTMTSMVDRLMLFDLIDRRSDERDRRIVRVCATEKGRQTVAHIAKVRQQELERFLSGLSAEEVDEFVDSIEKAARFLSQAKQRLMT